jgi:hypothetical protein
VCQIVRMMSESPLASGGRRISWRLGIPQLLAGGGDHGWWCSGATGKKKARGRGFGFVRD